MEKIIKDYNLFWQYPVITEKTFYLQNKNDKKLLQVPWATIIDKHLNKNKIILDIKKHIDMKHTYYTCCQHISFRDLIPFFKKIQISVVYSPHKIKGEDYINGIKIEPCPLYAVNYEDPTKNHEFKNKDFMSIKRKYLYSFMGGYNPKFYMSEIRNNIFNLPIKPYNYINNTGNWHFNKIVYSTKQNAKQELNIDNSHINNTKNYNNILLDSIFSLCPSGSGPNSIRFWESLAVGSIPVLLSDKLDLPKNINWQDIIIIIPEKEISNIDIILNNISVEKQEQMKLNCLNIYEKLKCNYKNI
ncbi:putative exostosin family protein [Cafeteria roenbergensis virus]|uniref:Putative exostosin family protein n=1 Tax=Cafeteria roenbergensis virus (strain BV-PW1) TaxID=693272 RepID=E3T530_CROVB|nr:putative exostosin family protein [Cafeteria roenbergensis virus BV-PW1]ADO67293.1 putative exostosin family protein [Cafeteria roenbergensis virus BV-PW1]